MSNPALREALSRVVQARNHFNNADNDRLDAAIYELTAAELHLRAVLRRAREEIPVFSDGKSDTQVFRATAYPMPQLKQFRNNQVQTHDGTD